LLRVLQLFLLLLLGACWLLVLLVVLLVLRAVLRVILLHLRLLSQGGTVLRVLQRFVMRLLYGCWCVALQAILQAVPLRQSMWLTALKAVRIV
jgi:hypothetical protein